jgi:hypothetical protein
MEHIHTWNHLRHIKANPNKAENAHSKRCKFYQPKRLRAVTRELSVTRAVEVASFSEPGLTG